MGTVTLMFVQTGSYLTWNMLLNKNSHNSQIFPSSLNNGVAVLEKCFVFLRCRMLLQEWSYSKSNLFPEDCCSDEVYGFNYLDSCISPGDFISDKVYSRVDKN